MLIPFTSSMNFSNVKAQEYGSYDDDNMYSKYPTDENKYECRTGPFEGFFVSSVEFCKFKFDKDDDRKDNKDHNNPPPTQNPISNITINKELYVCNTAQQNPTNFTCGGPNSIIPLGPNSGKYIPCSETFCFVDASDFKVEVFKDIALAQLLSSVNNTINLANGNYIVTEGSLEDRIRHDTSCDVAGFDHFQLFTQERQGNVIFYEICVNYKGECSGTISDGETKECTVQNYLVSAFILDPITGESDEPEPMIGKISEFEESSTNNINALDLRTLP
jgi:hypothetical protein